MLVRVTETSGHHLHLQLVLARRVEFDVDDLEHARRLAKYGGTCLHLRLLDQILDGPSDGDTTWAIASTDVKSII